MPSTTITGLASGIQWKDTVDLLMQIEARPLDRVKQMQTDVQSKVSAWNGLQEKMSTFSSRSGGMDSRSELLTKSVGSSDSDLITASANANASSSIHTVFVNQLAQAHILVHSGWADVNTTAVRTGAGGQFTYSLGAESVTVSVPSGATLAELVSKINSDVNNPGITASYIDDGGAVNPIHLVLTSSETGADNVITINDASTNLGGTGTEFDTATFTTTQSAQNSQIQVDGFPTAPPPWIERDSNSINDVINGVTMILKNTTPSTVTLSISEDTTSIKQRIKDWVSAYNDVLSDIATKTRYDSENKIQGVLMGDSQIYNIRSQLQEISSTEVPGLADNSTYKTLGAIGLETGSSSMIVVDDSKLDDAMEEDLDSVVNLFVFSSASTSQALTYFTRTTDTIGGKYDVVATYTAAGNLDSSGVNTIGGYAATVSGNTLIGKENTPVSGLRINFTNPGGGPSTATATVYVGTGVSVIGKNTVDLLTDGIDGLITAVKENYQDQIEAYDDQIRTLEARLVDKRAGLERKFLAMENAVSKAKTQSSWLSSVGS